MHDKRLPFLHTVDLILNIFRLDGVYAVESNRLQCLYNMHNMLSKEHLFFSTQ